MLFLYPVNRPDRPLAPVAVFAYKRPAHLRKTLESLQRDPLFKHSDIHIYCDGPRTDAEVVAVRQTREVVREFATPRTRLVLKDCNQGLRKSIVEGVGELAEGQGRVIVVEDDLVVGSQFLSFMNAALDRYVDDDTIYQVSGHQFPVAIAPGESPLFLPFTTTWGWATWKRAWRHFDASGEGYQALVDDKQLRRRFDLEGCYPYFRMLQKQQAGQLDSWGILWYLSVFRRQGRTVFPRRSLVCNIGFDGSGTHCSSGSGTVHRQTRWPEMNCSAMPEVPALDQSAAELILRHLAASSSIFTRLMRRMSGSLARIRL